MYNRGRALLDLKNYREAFMAFDSMLTLEPKNFEIWYYKGVSLEKMNHLDKAKECFKQVLVLKPDFKRAEAKLKKLKKSKKSKKKGGKSKPKTPLPSEKVAPGPGIARALQAIAEAEERAAEKRILINKRDETPVIEELEDTNEIAEEEVTHEEPTEPIDTSSFECFAEYDGEDEGCIECEIKDHCQEISRPEKREREPDEVKNLRNECFGEFDESDEGCMRCDSKTQCQELRISKGGT
jgi:tetratricopeptide (TPR) repeat protein